MSDASPSSSSVARSDSFAAIDLGSNSFHMKIARAVEQELLVVDRLRDRVRLAAGLTESNELSEEAQSVALKSLERFGERLRGIPARQVRAVGTNTLRRARNSRAFLKRAEQALGHHIEIIDGREEARLIYLGVAHTLSNEAGRRLVVDIGGGSTECIIGQQFDPIKAESLFMGCVSYTNEFFSDGMLSEENFHRAETAAEVEIETIEPAYRELGWDAAVGASGTILATEQILRQNGWTKQGVDARGLKKFRKALVSTGAIRKLSIAGLSEDRAPVIPGGLAILRALFSRLNIERMMPSSGALREGVIYDLVGRNRHDDVRDVTIEGFAKRFQVDEAQAHRVASTAFQCLKQVETSWQLDEPELAQHLNWAARLHEVGIAVSYTGYHKHGAYLIRNSTMPGFSRDDQLLLAALIQTHRRRLTLDLLENLPHSSPATVLRLTVLLRLAVLLNRHRSDRALPPFKLSANKSRAELFFPALWLEEHPLTRADLVEESSWLKKVGFELWVR